MAVNTLIGIVMILWVVRNWLDDNDDDGES